MRKIKSFYFKLMEQQSSKILLTIVDYGFLPNNMLTPE